MKIRHYVPILIILFLSACVSDETLSPPEPDGQGNVTFLFTTGSEITTRTILSGPENLQHVEQVYLYIFNGTGDEATCKEVKQIPWPKPGEVGYQTTQRTYSIQLPPGDYTFLAIGLDDQSGTTYGLPAAIATGSTLANAKAKLATGKTGADIAQSELFAGWEKATVKESGHTAVTIDLWRRVAGVLGYFNLFPEGVQTVQILLYEDQNTDIPLCKPTNNNTAEDTDFGTEITGTTDNRILLSFDTDTDWEFIGGEGGTGTGTMLYRKGAYVLPKQAPSANGVTHTLKIITLDAGNKVLKQYNVILQSSTDGTTGDTRPLTEARKFPLYANQLYSIGTKEAPVDLETGEDIVITVNPDWLVIEPTIPLE